MIQNMIILFLALALGMGSTDAKANVFASSVVVDFNGTFPATISYNLNQDATSVMIIIKDFPGGNVVKTITIQVGDYVTRKGTARPLQQGREVMSLVQGRQTAGTHAVHWLGKSSYGQDVASGIYFYKMTARSSDRVSQPFNVTKCLIYFK